MIFCSWIEGYFFAESFWEFCVFCAVIDFSGAFFGCADGAFTVVVFAAIFFGAGVDVLLVFCFVAVLLVGCFAETVFTCGLL